MKIQIPQPCQEDWQKMNPSQQGAFCQACQKEVIDFSQKTDREIYQYFQKNEGKVCGKFHNTQLDRDLQQFPNPKAHFWQKVLLVFPWFLGAKLLSAQNIESNNPQIIHNQSVNSLDKKAPIPIKPFSQKIKGKILDKDTQEPLDGVAIYTQNSQNPRIFTVSNASGEFELTINEQDTHIGFSRLGYHIYELPLAYFIQKADNQLFEIQLESKIIALEGVTIESFEVRVVKERVGAICIKRKHLFFGRIWDFIKKPFQKKGKDI